jgi:hypothetical protein
VFHSAIAAMAAAVEPTKTASLPGRFASVAGLGNSPTRSTGY